MSSLTKRLSRRTSTGRYIPEVDGMRFVAIILVLVFHASFLVLGVAKGRCPLNKPFGGTQCPMIHVWDSVIGQGRYGVHLFFILSGFILGLPFATGKVDLRKYYKRRLTRLEPPYLLALTICFLLAPAGMAAHYGAGMLYAHNLFFHHVNPVNGALWSLEVEIQFYLSLPLLASVFLIEDRARRRMLLISAIAIATMIQIPREFPVVLADSLIGTIQFFLTGMLLADLYDPDATKSREWDFGAMACVGLFLVGGRSAWFYPALPLIGFVLFLAMFRGSTTRRVLSNRYIATIGGMAYSIYLMHVPVMYLLARVMPTEPFLFSVALIATSLAVGLMFFVLIEKPCMDPDWPHKLWVLLRGDRVTRDEDTDRLAVSSSPPRL